MRFNTFIANLRNFNEMKRELTDKKDLLSDMYYHHSGVKGCDPSKIPVHGSEEASADAKLIQAERISELERK